MSSSIAGVEVPDSDLCHVQWRAQAWIVENGPLVESNVMDYFALSPFYDRKSSNQVLRMQTMFSGQPKLDPDSEREALRRFVGIEYALVTSRPDDRDGGLFVVEKRDRKGYDEHYLVASYYILRGSIYQAPSLYSTLSARVITSLSALKQLLELAREHKPTYDARQSYAWKIKEKIENPDQNLEKLSGDHRPEEPTHPTQESERMDIDSTGPAKEPSTKSTMNKPTPETHELTNPILFRALQNTIANFPGFKPPSNTDSAPAAPLGISTSQAPSPNNPSQLSAVSSGSHDHLTPASATQQPNQLPPRNDSQQEGQGGTSSVAAAKAPGKSSGTGTGKKKQKLSA